LIYKKKKTNLELEEVKNQILESNLSIQSDRVKAEAKISDLTKNLELIADENKKLIEANRNHSVLNKAPVELQKVTQDEPIASETNTVSACTMCQELKVEIDKSKDKCDELNDQIANLKNDFQDICNEKSDLTVKLQMANSDIERLTKGAYFRYFLFII
jgi:chromosome segregation ATPase